MSISRQTTAANPNPPTRPATEPRTSANRCGHGNSIQTRELTAKTPTKACRRCTATTSPPLGLREQLIAAGHLRGKGWIDTQGLGEPHRVIPIRADI